ncbi:glycogen debranching protein [Microbacterium schleiferi]|uniref:Glycogen debranching protein n=2 Tax=Microbacterium schleiferi TaxID=69362 RepID=A0A7S8RID9_9MICO|nr:glycogen debranching protein [Microbacterium schleiferi]
MPPFDVRTIPFSRRGSWMNLSPVIAAHTTVEDVHLVSHRTGMHPVLRIRPSAGAWQSAPSPAATPAILTWGEGRHTVNAAFESVDAVRMRGSAGTQVELADAAADLTPFTGTYLFVDPADGAAVFTSYETGCRYRVTPIRGELTVTGAQGLGQTDRAVTLSGAAGWEAVIEEFETARAPYIAESGFDEVVTEVSEEFHSYVDALAAWRTDTVPATGLACYVLWSATVAPAGFLERESVLMSKHWMDKVWSWDHCFNALALAPGLPDAAWDQFLAPFDQQDPSGALPDSITHSERLYNFVKPPIHGWALRRLRASGVTLSEEQLRDAYDRLTRWTRFWLERRTAPGSVLPVYQHGNDSGWDNSTMFDRDRVVHAPDLAAFLVIQLDVLAEVAAEVGESAQPWLARRDDVRDALMTQLWRGDGFVARGVTGGISGGADSTRSSLLTSIPIVAADLLDPEVSHALAQGVEPFLTDWGPATELVSSPHYESDGYWRGPIWAPSTMLIEDGLRRAGAGETADAVSLRFRRLCEASGFAENFDALTGEGLRDRAYTWTAAAYLVLAREAVARDDV